MKVNTDLKGKYKVSYEDFEDKINTDAGFALSFEMNYVVNDYVYCGLGSSYQLPRYHDGQASSGSYSFVPFYGIISLRLENSSPIVPYITGHIGYNLFNGTRKFKEGVDELIGDIYYGIGMTLEIYDKFLLEGMYKVNTGAADIIGTELDIDYSYISISLGLYFNRSLWEW
jgi:hypothetical protein